MQCCIRQCICTWLTRVTSSGRVASRQHSVCCRKATLSGKVFAAVKPLFKAKFAYNLHSPTLLPNFLNAWCAKIRKLQQETGASAGVWSHCKVGSATASVCAAESMVGGDAGLKELPQTFQCSNYRAFWH